MLSTRLPRPLDDEDYAALAGFRRQIRDFLYFSEKAARMAGLQPQQHQAMLAIRALSRHEPPTVGALAAQLGIRHHSAVGLVDRLVGNKLVERFGSTADRRRVLLRLTVEGATLLDRLSEAHRDELRRTGPDLVAALGLLLDRLDEPAAHPRLAQGQE